MTGFNSMPSITFCKILQLNVWKPASHYPRCISAWIARPLFRTLAPPDPRGVCVPCCIFNTIRTRSTAFLAPSFCMMCLRWTSIVRRLMPRSLAASLFDAAATIWASTSISRRVSWSRPGKCRHRISGVRPSCWWHVRAASVLSTRSTIESASVRFSMKSNAPFLIARTALGISPRPDMMKIGAE